MSTLTATKTRMTADEFFEFANRPENDGRWFELVRGKVIEVPAPTKIHGVVCSTIGYFLQSYVRNRGYGYLTSNDSGILLERDPDTVRGPDVALFEDAATFDDLHPKCGEVPPVLAVEVVTPDTKPAMLEEKIDDYLDNGVKVVWVVNPEARSVRQYFADRRPITLKDGQEIDGGEILPGFRCPVADLFAIPGRSPEKTA